MIRLDNAYRHSLVFFAVVIFFTSVANYTERYGLIPLFWIFVFAAASGPLVLSKLASGHAHLMPIAFWCASFLFVTITWYYWSPQDAIASQEVQTRLLSVIFLAVALVVFSDKEEQQLAQRWIAAAVLLAVALNVYELFHPLTFSDIPGRSQGLYPNVNQSGAALVLGLILSYQVIPDRLKLAFVGITAVGVIPTFSRSAMIGWLIVVAFFFMRAGVVAQFRRLAVLTVVVVGLIASPVWVDLQQTLEQRGVLNLDVVGRIAFFTGGQSEDASSTERKAVADAAWNLFGQRPLTGWGTNASNRMEGFDVGTHNIYLALMADHGILGLLLLPALLLSVLWGVNRRSFDQVFPWMMFMLVWGMFSHNILEERYILLATALTASIVASRRTREEPGPELASPVKPGTLATLSPAS